MAGIQISDAKAPWVMFERRAVEDRDASIREGRYVAKDVDFALITPHGSRDQIERVVSEWFEYLEQQVGEGRFERSWLREYKAAYENWREGKEIPLNGTPILNWPVLSPAQVAQLQHMKILTVEVLADANEEVISRLGMGGRSLVAKAKEFLTQVKTGKSSEDVVALRQQLEAMEAITKAQKEQIDTLMTQLRAGQGPTDGGQPLNQGGAFGTGDPGEILDKGFTKL